MTVTAVSVVANPKSIKCTAWDSNPRLFGFVALEVIESEEAWVQALPGEVEETAQVATISSRSAPAGRVRSCKAQLRSKVGTAAVEARSRASRARVAGRSERSRGPVASPRGPTLFSMAR